MAKKSRKKTIASTRPLPPEKKKQTPPPKNKKFLKSLFLKRGGKNPPAKIEKPVKKPQEKTAPTPAKQVAATAKPAEPAKQVAATAKPAEPAKQVAATAAEPATKEAPAPAKVGKRKLLAQRRQRIRGGILALIGLFSLIFIGWFIFGKMFRPQYLAEILPASESLAVLEVNTDGAAAQPKIFYELMSKYPVYGKEGLVRLLTYLMPLDFANDVDPWLGRRVGIALIKGADKGTIERIWFVESRDHEMTLDFMRSRALNSADEEVTSRDIAGYKVYGYPLSHLFEFTFINNYLVLAESGKAMQHLLESIAVGGRKLADEPSYAKASNNLAPGSLIFGYVDYRALYEAMAADMDFMARKGQDFMAFKPFLAVFRSAGVTVFADTGKFTLQTFTNLDSEALKGGEFMTFSEKYEGRLLAIAGEQPVLLAGGHDLTKELNRLQELFVGGTNTSTVIFEGLLEAQKQIYLGKDISLKDDVYPLLTGEYLFTVDNNLEKPQISAVLELQDRERDVPRFERIVTAFRNTSGIFTPRVQTVILPDGTTGQEIVASPEQVERYEETYGERSLTALRLGNTGWSIFYTTVEDKLLLSTDKSRIKDMIDRAEGNLPAGLIKTTLYSKVLEPAIRAADEIVNIKVGAITEALGLNDDERLKPYILPFANLAVAKNYFTDGISTIYYLEVI